MRVITGKARGVRLVTPEGLNTRPTSEMTKEAVFSMIHFEVEGAVFLDLFAGSGQMGIEALSRGASKAYFIDMGRDAQKCIRDNLIKTKLQSSSTVVAMEAKSFLAGCKDTFDIAFLDPPYESGILDEILPILCQKMSDNGVIICETQRNEELPDKIGDFVCKKPHRYGKAKITLYRREETEE